MKSRMPCFAFVPGTSLPDEDPASFGARRIVPLSILPLWSVRRIANLPATARKRMDRQRPTPLSPSPTILRAIGRQIARLSNHWGCPALHGSVRVEFTDRLRASVARCDLKRGIIRLSSALLVPRNRLLLPEVLAHEVAHLAVHHLYGSKAEPHGKEWRQLMQAVGLEPRLRLRLPDPATQDAFPPGPRLQYKYHCPVCQSVYRSRRRDSRIRCRPCLEAGLSGLMTITRRSLPPESSSR